MAGAAILRRSGLPAVKVVESRRILHEAFKGPVAAGSKIHGGSPPFLFWAQKKRRPCLPDWEKRTPPCGVSIRFFQVYLSMTDVPCNLVAALVSGVRYSQGSGAYQSSVRNRSKLVVNSVGKPANMLVNQGFGGIIENFNKKYPLPVEEFERVIERYNIEHDNNIKPKLVYNAAIKANIIRENPDKFGIEFCDENLLAYFTALYLNRILNEEKGAEELKYILDNICFQPNGDIILFLSYITSNIQILNPIMNSLITHMKEWDELSIDTDNVGYLSEISTDIKPKLPDSREKQQIKEEKTTMEKDIVEKQKHSSESLYSYDESKVDSFGNKISKSISYLELVAKILPSFRHILKGDQKQRIVDILYRYPNKLLYFMLKDIDENYNEIINEILDSASRTRKGKLITRDMITNELQNQSIAYILSIYDFVASTCVNGKTIDDLNKFDYFSNTNYLIQNIMMEENAGNFHQMAVKAESLNKNSTLGITKQMVMLVVRKYFLCHDIPLVGEAQHVIDVFFGDNVVQKRALKMAHAKNKIEKR